jgi:FtsP/CotA-like multicopper oxidase with cupredoxin domain
MSNFLSRRRFVQGVTAGALLAGPGRKGWPEGFAGSERTVLSGPDIDLSIGRIAVNFTGKRRLATAVNGRVPGPLLRFREGDTVNIRVTNGLSAPTSIHWHGIIVPADMDGVPGLSFSGIAPGETFTYRFAVNQSGTYWYHSHSRFQEQVGLYGPIVIEPREEAGSNGGGGRNEDEREHVILISDWTDEDPEHIYRTLKLQSDAFNYGKRTAADLIRGSHESRIWDRMRMSPTDLLDVSGHVYTYLMNGITPAGNWTGEFKRGEKVRLRIVNGSSMSIFDVRIPGLKLTMVAADGQEVEPVTVDEFRIAAAEVYDVMVEPDTDRAYTIVAQALDRSGFARGTLAPRSGMQAEVPSLDARGLLTLNDMGMSPEMTDMPGKDMPGLPKYGPTVDSVAMLANSRLDDPGVGLRNNGRRVLTYSDLHTRGGPIDARAPGREIQLHLTGHMARYIWSFNGQKFSESEPLRFILGERLRITLINDSMMIHPIHLHGMWSELETADGQFLVRKHTVMVQPGQRLSFAVTADALGSWAFHCHLIYHMEAGMFREVRVERA